MGLPGALVALGNLRYDFVLQLIRTYGIWFFSYVSAVVSVLTSTLFRDERSLLLIFSWIAFQANIFVDAGVVGQRSLLIANVFAAICYSMMAIALSLKITDELHPFDIIRVNDHGLPATAVARDNLSSMVVVILRNVYRSFHHVTGLAPAESQPLACLVECVSFRCSLRMQLMRPMSPEELPKSQAKLSTISPAEAIIRSANKTQLFFTPFLDPIDARRTILPLPWLWMTRTPTRNASHRSRLAFVGMAGFIVSNVSFLAGLLSPSLQQRPAFRFATGLAASCSEVFVSVCIGMAQRQVFWAVATSFDFVFIGLQAMAVHFTFLAMIGWQPVLVVAFCSDFVWNFWIICWDALPPSVRQRMGLTPRFAAWIGLGLLLFRVACGVGLFVILAPSEVNDRAVVSVKLRGAKFELRPIAWYVSCNMTIFSWAVRILWRLWFAKGTELVVLDGPVAYNNPSTGIHRHNPVTVVATPVHVAPIVRVT